MNVISQISLLVLSNMQADIFWSIQEHVLIPSRILNYHWNFKSSSCRLKAIGK